MEQNEKKLKNFELLVQFFNYNFHNLIFLVIKTSLTRKTKNCVFKKVLMFEQFDEIQNFFTVFQKNFANPSKDLNFCYQLTQKSSQKECQMSTFQERNEAHITFYFA